MSGASDSIPTVVAYTPKGKRRIINEIDLASHLAKGWTSTVEAPDDPNKGNPPILTFLEGLNNLKSAELKDYARFRKVLLQGATTKVDMADVINEEIQVRVADYKIGQAVEYFQPGFDNQDSEFIDGVIKSIGDPVHTASLETAEENSPVEISIYDLIPVEV